MTLKAQIHRTIADLRKRNIAFQIDSSDMPERCEIHCQLPMTDDKAFKAIISLSQKPQTWRCDVQLLGSRKRKAFLAWLLKSHKNTLLIHKLACFLPSGRLDIDSNKGPILSVSVPLASDLSDNVFHHLSWQLSWSTPLRDALVSAIKGTAIRLELDPAPDFSSETDEIEQEVPKQERDEEDTVETRNHRLEPSFEIAQILEAQLNGDLNEVRRLSRAFSKKDSFV